ncbi:hypothetical protein Leryth_025549 [Lithospermum erythrorhizon]|nr:hypothetical protein Leryth_025549 [Lithospermum erythrorhizon]
MEIKGLDALTFLLAWFERFHQYKGREFYIAGERYSGHYAPQLSQAILQYNKVEKKTQINPSGFMELITLDNRHKTVIKEHHESLTCLGAHYLLPRGITQERRTMLCYNEGLNRQDPNFYA